VAKQSQDVENPAASGALWASAGVVEEEKVEAMVP